MEDNQEKEEGSKEEQKDEIRDMVNNALDVLNKSPEKDPSIKLPEEVNLKANSTKVTESKQDKTGDIGKISQDDAISKIEEDQTMNQGKEDIGEEKPLTNESEEMTKMA